MTPLAARLPDAWPAVRPPETLVYTMKSKDNSPSLALQEGAREVYACCSHAVFSPPAVQRLSSGVFEEVIVTNTIPQPPVGAEL